MKMLDIVSDAMHLLEGSFINYNNELILIPKFNVYTLLDDVDTDDDFKVKLCEWFSRDCCCALRYKREHTLRKYWQSNTDVFNALCGTKFNINDMYYIYSYLGNGIHRSLAEKFVASGFDLSVIDEYVKIQFNASRECKRHFYDVDSYMKYLGR